MRRHEQCQIVILIDSVSDRGRLRGGCENSQNPPPTPRLAHKTLALVNWEELAIESDFDDRLLDLEGAGPDLVVNTSCEQLTRSFL